MSPFQCELGDNYNLTKIISTLKLEIVSTIYNQDLKTSPFVRLKKIRDQYFSSSSTMDMLGLIKPSRNKLWIGLNLIIMNNLSSLIRVNLENDI